MNQQKKCSFFCKSALTLFFNFSVFAAIAVSPVTFVFAQELLDNTPRAYRDEVNRLKLLPGAENVKSEVIEIETSIKRAEEALSTRDRDRANAYLKQARYAIEFIHAELGTSQLRQAIQEQKAQISKGLKEVKKLETEVSTLKEKEQNLKTEIAKYSK